MIGQRRGSKKPGVAQAVLQTASQTARLSFTADARINGRQSAVNIHLGSHFLKNTRPLWVLVGLLWSCGIVLRLTILAVPPVIPSIRSGLGMSATEIGFLSSLPVLLFALAALPGSHLIARLGARATLLAGLVVVALGTGLRGGSWNAATLYLTTAIMGAGVAIMQPTMPALVREWLPARIGFGTAVYSNGLLIGEIIPVLAAPFIMQYLNESWRLELAVWALPVLLIAMLAAAFAPAAAAPAANATEAGGWRRIWRNPLIWRLGMMFGSVNAMYFATNAFLPAYLNNLGRDDVVNGALIALNVGQLPASFLILATAKRLERRAWPYVVACAVMTASVVGLVFMVGPWTVFWAALLGFGGASSLILGLTLPALLSEKNDVGLTAAAMFTLSYAIAVAIALLCGAAWDLSGVARMAFVPVVVCTVSLGFSASMMKARRHLL
jgi:CP family cyanate transporter-like MFS transporter